MRIPGRRRQPDAARRPVRRFVAWLVGSIVALVVLCGALAALQLASVAHDLNHAADLIDSATAHLEGGQVGQARTEFDDARQLLTNANSGLYQNFALDVTGLLPAAHQNLHALRETVGLALQMADGAHRILQVTQGLESPDGTLQVPLVGGAVPLDSVLRAQVAVDELGADLPAVGYQPSTHWLFPQVERAQRLVFEAAAQRRPQLDAVARGLQLLGSIAGTDKPLRFLIAVANSAEMRGGGGMILSYGVLESDHGAFSLGAFGGIDELAIDEPVDTGLLTVPQDYLARWDGLQPTGLWRNTNLGPDLAFSAPIMEAMYSAKTGDALDGVIQIDPAGLAAILQGIGPVNVEGLGQVDATNVVDLTLNRAYIDFPDRDQRQELLGDVAHATFDALVSGQFGSLRPLGTALFDAAQQRHIEVFLNSFQAQRNAATFDATGAMPAPDQIDHAILTVQNFSKNKLDYYVDTSLDLTGDRPAGQPGTMTATITVANTAPAGQRGAEYVFGPNAEGEVAGLYRGTVSLYLPTGATLAGSSGDSTAAPAATSENGRTVVGFGVEVPAGETRTVTLQLAFAPRPAGPYSMTLAPVPRVRPTVVSVDIDAGDGAGATRAAAPLTVTERIDADTTR